MNVPRPLLDPDGIAQLTEALSLATAAGGENIMQLLDSPASSPSDLAAVIADSESRLATITEVFLLGKTLPEAQVAAALSPLPLTTALEAGLVERHENGLRAAVSLTPYETFDGTQGWVIADRSSAMRPGHRLPRDYVLGVNNTATTLTRATIRLPVERALDLGTGAGVQALELSRHATAVTATDISARALRFAATTAALNGLDWELLEGDMLAPVSGRRFDLVVSNLPFVVSPGAIHFTYRDSGRAGDSIIPELISAAPSVLTDGGHMQFLANWTHQAGIPWQERLAQWLEGTGLDAWILQREVLDPIAYISHWLRDADQEHDAEYARQWQDWFATHQVEAIGMGIVTLRNRGAADPIIRIEEMPQRYSVPLGSEIPAWFERADWLRTRPAETLLQERYILADALTLYTESVPQAGDWHTQRHFLSLNDGLRWQHEVQPIVPALLAGCDGTATMGELLTQLADQHELDLDVLRQVAITVLPLLIEHALVLPVALAGSSQKTDSGQG